VFVQYQHLSISHLQMLNNSNATLYPQYRANFWFVCSGVCGLFFVGCLALVFVLRDVSTQPAIDLLGSATITNIDWTSQVVTWEDDNKQFQCQTPLPPRQISVGQSYDLFHSCPCYAPVACSIYFEESVQTVSFNVTAILSIVGCIVFGLISAVWLIVVAVRVVQAVWPGKAQQGCFCNYFLLFCCDRKNDEEYTSM
jgi:hypothetical protein